MKDILNHIVPKSDKLIKYGQVDEKIILELKMTTSLYEYIEIVTNYYDWEDYPYTNNWKDVEGMGYGWAWLNYEESDWHKMMGKLVLDEADYLLSNSNVILYFVYENEKVKTYHFVLLDKWRKDIVISFSNDEIDF